MMETLSRRPRKTVLVSLLLLFALPGWGSASADTSLTCEGQGRLRWQSCDRVGDADGNRLIVRYCFGDEAGGSFTGRIRILASADEGNSRVGGGRAIWFAGMKGCVQDEVGGSEPITGKVFLYVETQGFGYYSVTALTTWN